MTQIHSTYHFITSVYNLYLLFLLVIPVCIICMVVIYYRHQYNNAFVVDNALVLIIGISQFDDKKSLLLGIPRSVQDLETLWKETYNYSVYICNKDTLYCTKHDIIDFVDDKLSLISDSNTKCIIIHIISHGNEKEFLSSDLKKIQFEFIQHELVQAFEEKSINNAVKIIFIHGCRGNVNYYHNSSHEIETKQLNDQFNHRTVTFMHFDNQSNQDYLNMSIDANFVTVWGNIRDRAMSDNGHFTDCIVESFTKNVNRIIKGDLLLLLSEIGNNLENRTQHAELCNFNSSIRYNAVRFEKCKQRQENDEIFLHPKIMLHEEVMLKHMEHSVDTAELAALKSTGEKIDYSFKKKRDNGPMASAPVFDNQSDGDDEKIHYSFKNKQMRNWNNDEILNWIRCMKLDTELNDKILNVITDNACTGEDIMELKTVDDVSD
eukprot:421668_1